MKQNISNLLKILFCLCVFHALSISGYALNAVGYANISVPPGFTLLANPLKNFAAQDIISHLITGPEGLTVYKLIDGKFIFNSLERNSDGQLEWSDPTMTLDPGEGCFIYNPTDKFFTLTFVGDLEFGIVDTAINQGFSILSSKIAQGGALESRLQFPPEEGDVVYRLINGRYLVYNYARQDDGKLGWDVEPTIEVGESFLLYTKISRVWERLLFLN